MGEEGVFKNRCRRDELNLSHEHRTRLKSPPVKLSVPELLSGKKKLLVHLWQIINEISDERSKNNYL